MPVETTVSEAPATPQAFHFESGTLEIGEFDPWTLGDNIFDPCTEITAEEFAAAGFMDVEPIEEEYRGLNQGLSSCFFVKHHGVKAESFNNNNADRANLEQQGIVLQQYSSELLPSLFVHRSSNPESVSCFAQVDTSRGGIVAGAGGRASSGDLTTNCEAAIENLENLYRGSSS